MNTEHLGRKLEEEKSKLEEEMQTVGRKSTTVPNDWEAAPAGEAESDVADQADVFVNRDTDAAVLADLEARYDSVLEALERLKKGEYGKCEVCGEPVEEDRLEANPSATTCATHMR